MTISATVKVLHLFLHLSFLLILLAYIAIKINSIRIEQSVDDPRSNCSEAYKVKCVRLTSDSKCHPEGYINYLHLFYCEFGKHPLLGYTALTLWLAVLFYLLANTAANYFCANLEGLSNLLRLPPTLAGVTLLSLGNGAPDAFSSIVSFMGNGTDAVGLNSVLGGAFFVSCAVVGIISICFGSRRVTISKFSFMRDLCFLLLVLLVLLIVIHIGEINVWGAMAFTSLYIVYILLVTMRHLFQRNYSQHEEDSYNDCSALPSYEKTVSSILTRDDDELAFPLLVSSEKDGIFSKASKSEPPAYYYYCDNVLYLIELPLYLPRRLTIPDVHKERWCKPLAVASVTLAPVLLAVLWNSKREDIDGSAESLLIYLFSAFLGLTFGVAAFVKTKEDGPPTRFLFPWLAGGFLMGVIWTYIIAQELVSLLISLGVVLDISPSILGLTVLAWGNSLGDLISSLVMALNGGASRVQVAISGCYGGPIFNILVGLGFSLVFFSWGGYPSAVAIPKDPTLYETMGFLIGGLLWTLVILPRRGMRPDRLLGCGLIAIYLCFLCLRILQSLGVLPMQ